MSRPCAHILCLVGAPACGKSSLSQALQLLLQKQQQIQTIHLVSFDAVEAQLQPQTETSQFDVAAWRQVPLSPYLALNRTSHALQSSRRPHPLSQARLVSFESIRQYATAASPSNPTLIIADDTLHLQSMRRSLWTIARECSAAIRCQPHPLSPLIQTLALFIRATLR